MDVKKGSCDPFLLQLSQQLLVVDVHGDFEAKTNVTVFWSFPFHSNSPQLLLLKEPNYWDTKLVCDIYNPSIVPISKVIKNIIKNNIIQDA